jgi:hypothetical protein
VLATFIVMGAWLPDAMPVDYSHLSRVTMFIRLGSQVCKRLPCQIWQSEEHLALFLCHSSVPLHWIWCTWYITHRQHAGAKEQLAIAHCVYPNISVNIQKFCPFRKTEGITHPLQWSLLFHISVWDRMQSLKQSSSGLSGTSFSLPGLIPVGI